MAFFTRQLNSAFIWELGVSYERDKYDNGGTINTTTALTTLRWRVGPRVSVRFIYGYSSISAEQRFREPDRGNRYRTR